MKITSVMKDSIQVNWKELEKLTKNYTRRDGIAISTIEEGAKQLKNVAKEIEETFYGPYALMPSNIKYQDPDIKYFQF